MPNSFAIQLSAGALADLFDRAKGLLADGELVRVIQRIGRSSFGADEQSSDLAMRATIGAFLLLYFHEIAHVARDHHAQLSASEILEQPGISARADYASRRRVVENDADFIAMGLLARYVHVVPPFLKSEKQLDGRVKVLWCLLSSFCLFSVFADSSSAGQADAPDEDRWYYSPLVRYHVLPLAASSNVGLHADAADTVAKDFTEALQAVHGRLPVLANYARWKYLFDADLERWKQTELERVLWQSAGRFSGLLSDASRDR